jgi:hypothetical protein
MKTFCTDLMLKHCAANRKRRFSALPNVSLYIYDVKIAGFTRSFIYILYDISMLRVKENTSLNQSAKEIYEYVIQIPYLDTSNYRYLLKTQSILLLNGVTSV